MDDAESKSREPGETNKGDNPHNSNGQSSGSDKNQTTCTETEKGDGSQDGAGYTAESEKGSTDHAEKGNGSLDGAGYTAESEKGSTDHAENPTQEQTENSSESENEEIIDTLAAMIVNSKEPQEFNGTGVLFDKRMLLHKNEWDPNFPECPGRIKLAFQRCVEMGLINRCTRIQAQMGTEDQVKLQHSQELIEKLQSAVTMETSQLKELSKQYDSIYISNATYECALLSVGSVMEMMDQVLKNKVRNGLAIVRPPGHHAMHNKFCGFSYFNNVAIAAKHALETYKLKRILIVDWDIHHGQATQQMFYDDPRVLYFSIHRYEYGTYWPNLRESDYDFIGSGKGAGYNINIPVNQTGMGDSDYMAVFQQVLMPIANEFDPDLVLVSAGFDSAIGDLKGEMSVTPAAFAHFTHMLKSLAEGRVCVCLEGGYCLQSLAESVALTLRSLLGDPCPLLPPFKEPSDSICTSILNAIKVLRPYWKSLCYQGNEEEEVSSLCYQGNEVEECRFSEVNTLPPKEGVEFMTEKNRPKEFPLAYTYPEEVQRLYLETDKFKVQIDALVKETNLSSATNKCCLAYDEGMKLHVARNMYFHPEDPDRISRIYERMVEWGLVKRCLRVENRMAAEEELEYIHTAQHIEFMKTLEEKNLIELRQIQSKYNSIYLSNETYTCARMASGFVLDVVKAVLTGEAQSGVAVVRPPGHHAERTHPMGFCFFNNIAIAAEYAKREFGLKRILILDWDVHHGNGTQHQFYEDPNVLFISLHRYDWSFFYPSSDHGNHTFVGEGPGEGFNVNIPFNRDYMGDAEYIAAFQQIVMPIAYEYGPELVLVSAGFDAAMGDPLGHYLITPIGYAHMTHMLSSLANGRVVLALEGGYNLDSISNSMARCMSVLLGDVVPHLSYVKPKESAIETICNVLDTHKKYWKSLKCRVNIYQEKEKEEEKEDVDDVKEDNQGSETGDDVKDLSAEIERVQLEDSDSSKQTTDT